MKNNRNQSPARAYYRSHILPLFVKIYMDSSGQFLSEEEFHELLKLRCNPRVKLDANGNPKSITGGSTKDFSEEQHWEYNERCKSFIEALTGYKFTK